MTRRTEANPPAPIERAVLNVIGELDAAIRTHYREEGLQTNSAITEPEFRRIIALHFHDRTLTEWCRIFGIPDATDPEDRGDK